MKQQPFTPSRAALGNRPAPLPSPALVPTDHAPAPQRLHLPVGQGQLLWLDAGCELRCLAGTAMLRGPLITALRLPAHTAWRSPQGLWLGIEAQAMGAVLQMTPAISPAPAPWHAPHATGAHEKSRPGHSALQRLGDALRKRFVRPAQPAG